MDLLLNGAAWVSMLFRDGTIQTVYTSLSPEYLSRTGVAVREGYLFDLNRLKYVAFREDAVNVEVSLEKPHYDSEVQNFASRFI